MMMQTRTLNAYSLSGSGLNANQMLDNLNNMKTPYGQEFYAARVQKRLIRYMTADIWCINQSSSHGYNKVLCICSKKTVGEYINPNNVLRQYKTRYRVGEKLNMGGDEENG